MDVTRNALGPGAVSCMSASSAIAHPAGRTRIATELHAVHISPPNGWARPHAAVSSNRGNTRRNVPLLATLTSGPDTSIMCFRSGGYYIQGDNRDIEVYSLDNWVTTLMSDPRWSDCPGLPLRWHCGRWRVDDGAGPNVTTPLDWWDFGLVRSEPPRAVELPEFTEVLISTVLEPFDFPAGRVGDFLKNWFVHDWFNPLPSQQGGWPAWAITYAKCNAVLSLYCGQRLLSGTELLPVTPHSLRLPRRIEDASRKLRPVDGEAPHGYHDPIGLDGLINRYELIGAGTGTARTGRTPQTPGTSTQSASLARR